MKNVSRKDIWLLSDYTPKQRGISLLHSIYSALIYVLLGFAVFETLYVMCNCIGAVVSGSMDVAIRDLLRMLPLFIFTGILTHCSIALVNIDNEINEEKRNKRLKKNAIEMIVIGAILSIYVLVLIIIKKYSSFIEGYPTKLYPLDLFLFGLLTILLGVIGLLIWKKHKNGGAYVLPYHQRYGGLLRRGFDRVFYILFLLGSGFSFAAFVQSFFIADWTHGHLFYIIMLDALFLDCVFNFVAYRYFFLNMKDEARAEGEGNIGFVMFVQGLLIYVLYMVAFSLDLEAPNAACAGLLPVEYTASFNAATFLYILFDIIPGLVAMLKSFPDRRKLAKANAKKQRQTEAK